MSSQIDKWNERYRSGEHMAREPSPLLVDAIRDLAPGRALELACGTGANAIYLARNGWDVVAIDGSSEAIDILRLEAHDAGIAVDARVQDLERQPLDFADASFELVSIFFFLWRPLFNQSRRVLRSGGLFVAAINTVDDDPRARAMNPEFLLQRGDLRAEFGDWEVLKSSEGHAANHRRAVAEIVARKPA